jgi:hypothetical protein
LHGSVDPAKASFLFRAMGDGEYWFLIRSMDASGQLQPRGGDRPGLRVVVDTTPPKLQLEARRGDAGQVVARWQVADANLKPESLKLEYRAAADQPWQAVALDRQGFRTTGGVCTGEVSWWPPSGSPRAEVRAEVADAAGNTSVSHAQLGQDGESGLPPKPTADDGPLSPAASAKNAAPGGAMASGKGPQRGPLLEMPSTGKPRPAQVPRETIFRSPDGTIAIQIDPALGDQHVRADPQGGRSNYPGFPPGSPAPRERIRMVSSTRFQLDYDVESVGPSGVDRVELWGTRDGGRTWTSFGADEDKRSPLVVTVREEGIYGFRVAVRSGAGLGGEAPRPGDAPDVWVGVDWTKPLARIVAAEQTSGDRGAQLTIRWEAKDWMLAARPVSLYYAEARDGPWSAIAVGLENTGQYCWSIERQVPERLFLRLEVRDEAGNLGIAETPEPVYLDRRRPQVRIRDIRPLEEQPGGDRR